MLKIFHTADVHLGAKFQVLKEKASAQREQLKKTFGSLIQKAVAENASFLLIAGDLFDSNLPSQKDIDFVASQFQILKENNIQVLITPGNHDFYSANSVYKKADFENKFANLFIFKGKEYFKEYPEYDLTVYGSPHLRQKETSSPFKDIKKKTDSKFKIALIHGQLRIPGFNEEEYSPFTKDELSKSGFDYVALGHFHGLKDCTAGGVSAWYSGSPEFIGVDQKNSGYVLQVLLSEKVKVNPIKIGKINFDQKEIDLSKVKNLNQLERKILEGAQQNLIRVVALKGLRGHDLEIEPSLLEEELKSNFYNLRILNQSALKIDGALEKDFSQNLVISKFIAEVKDRISCASEKEKSILEDSLQLGIALLSGEKQIL